MEIVANEKSGQAEDLLVPSNKKQLKKLFMGLFLDLCWPLKHTALNKLCFLLRAMFLITSSCSGMETQVVPQINTIKTVWTAFYICTALP